MAGPPPNYSRKGGTFGSFVQIDAAALAQILAGPNGPVSRRLIEDGEIVKRGAQKRVGVYQAPPGAPAWATQRGGREPGRLRDSIVKRVTAAPGGIRVLVGSDDPIALIHHEGTDAHTITARRRPFLVFWSAKLGRVVRTKRVAHPGTKPNRYLTDALQDLRARY